MKYFKLLEDLPVLPLYQDLQRLLDEHQVNWGKHNQICINSIPGHTHDYFYGAGSIYYDWNNANNTTSELSVPIRQTPLEESDFTELCDVFKGTLFEDVYNEVQAKYTVGRVRLMRSLPKTCLTWHVDTTTRIHLPLKTQEECRMVIEDEVMYMPEDTWWMTDTTRPHTAFNGSKTFRVHLVVVVL